MSDKKQMKGITYCGNCSDYDWKKHKCKICKSIETDARKKFYDDCPLEDVEPVQKWIPVSERVPEDGDVRFYMCVVENHEEDLPMFCQYEEDRGFGFWRDYYDADTLGFVDSEFHTNEELGYEKVVAWMPLPEPYRESEDANVHECDQ